MTAVEFNLSELHAERERRERQESLVEEADRLAGSLRDFIRGAWHTVVPIPLIDTWHVDSLADHLQALYEREITRLIVTIPPGTLKSTIVSVLAPAWRWTRDPAERLVGASWSSDYSERDTRFSRQVVQSAWFRARWPEVTLASDENLKTRYSNDQGGRRVATYVGGGTGERGDVLLLDDPHNAREAQSMEARQLENAIAWWGNTWSSRLNDSPDRPGVMVVIGQRIHERDLIGALLEDRERWTHLCLPARYEKGHPHVTPLKRVLGSGRVVQGDMREVEGEILAPRAMSEARLIETAKDMGSFVAAGQLQQRPAAHEGAILKRTFWRYFDPSLLDDDRIGLLPTFQGIVSSWDTSFKDKTSSDYVAGGTWGIRGGDRYLLRLTVERMSLAATKTAMLEHRAWALQRWPKLPYRALIEKSANGVEIIEQLRREVPGIVPVVASTDKTTRAFAAAPDIESGNVFLPGFSSPEGSGYDEARTPASVQDLVEQAAKFPSAAHDDIVDMVTQLVNWARVNALAPLRTESAVNRRVAKPSRLQGAGG